MNEIFFMNQQANIFDVDIGEMSYYIDPNDNTKTKYLWYGMYGYLNENNSESTSTIPDDGEHSYIKSDIFTPNLKQYDNNKNLMLPLQVEDASSGDNFRALAGNKMCTSPTTNDIFTCLQDSTETYDHINCKIYFVNDNKWSEDVIIKFVGVPWSDVICFNDSYFVSYNRYPSQGNNDILYSLIDLKGNLVFNEVPLALNISSKSSQSDTLSISKGDETFVGDIKKNINENATNSFMLLLHVENNKVNNDILGIYYYYTNINDTKSNPIYWYNQSVIADYSHNNLSVSTGGISNDIIPINNECCYITIYREPNGDGQTIYAIITDIYGNIMQNAMITKDSYFDVIPQIIHLTQQSLETQNYVMITYGYNTTRSYAISDTIMCSVYELTYNDSNCQLMKIGLFESVKSTDKYFQDVLGYQLIDTDNIIFSYKVEDPGSSNDILYAQTWKIDFSL